MSMDSISNFFEKQWTQHHPQDLSGLSRALYPTTFLEVAVHYNYMQWFRKIPIWFYLQVHVLNMFPTIVSFH